MKHRYQATLRVHDGWEYNDPKGYSQRTVTIKANNLSEAYAEAQRIAAADDKYDVSVRRKDIVRLFETNEKKSFDVDLEFLYHTSVKVGAASAEDAVEKVREMSLRQIFGRIRRISIFDLEDGQPISVTLPNGKTKYI